MKLSLLIFPIMLVFALFAQSSLAAPQPGNFFKDLEGVGQRIRDAVISAGPAVQVVGDAVKILKPTQ